MRITLSGKRRLQLRAWTEEEWTQELSMTAGSLGFENMTEEVS